MIRDQHALDVVGMVDDVDVAAARWHEQAIDIAEARIQFAHALERVGSFADVELKVRLRRRAALGSSRSACAAQPHPSQLGVAVHELML